MKRTHHPPNVIITQSFLCKNNVLTVSRRRRARPIYDRFLCSVRTFLATDAGKQHDFTISKTTVFTVADGSIEDDGRAAEIPKVNNRSVSSYVCRLSRSCRRHGRHFVVVVKLSYTSIVYRPQDVCGFVVRPRRRFS